MGDSPYRVVPCWIPSWIIRVLLLTVIVCYAAGFVSGYLLQHGRNLEKLRSLQIQQTSLALRAAQNYRLMLGLGEPETPCASPDP